MAVGTSALQTDQRFQLSWLRNRNWDLTWITLSVVLVATPYLAYLGILSVQSIVRPLADLMGASVESMSRNIINAVIALVAGGPHMYATFTRTALDKTFTRNHPRLIKSSLIIPVVVIALAFFNLSLLLTIFFFWASIHVLHQIIFITELYNNKGRPGLKFWERAVDYGVILTSLYPLAAWKISTGEFSIGPNDIGAVVGSILPLGPWMIWLAGGAFAVALTAWVVKSVMEWQRGTLHGPKTIFIGLTAVASFWVPALGNLDTAFQGMNLWHSLQYLALTWMLNRLRQERGELEASPFVKRLSTKGSARRFYLFNIGLTIADVGLAAILFVIMRFVMAKPFDFAFDRAYYIAVLSFLWIHYYHDHYLFTQPSVIKAQP
jgi:hypothetical protein